MLPTSPNAVTVLARLRRSNLATPTHSLPCNGLADTSDGYGALAKVQASGIAHSRDHERSGFLMGLNQLVSYLSLRYAAIDPSR